MATDVVLLEGVRIGFGAFGGSLKEWSATDLGAIAARGALERAKVDPGWIDHTVFANVVQTSADAIYLARHGFAVVGVDFSSKAIATARAKAQRANVVVDFHVADVTRLDSLRVREPFDFVLDIGCLHALDAAGRARYAEHIARLTRPGSVLMLYAFSPRPPEERGHLIRFRNVGITPEEVERMFAQHFALEHVEYGADCGERASAWYWFRRQ